MIEVNSLSDALSNSAERIRSFVERVERLNEEKAEIAGHVSEVLAEAKSAGYNVKAIREVIRLRKMQADERAELETDLDLYLHALGMAPAGEAGR